MLYSKQPNFCLNPAQSPTHANLVRYLQEQGWKRSRFNWRSQFNDSHLQFDERAAQQLEYKHLLAQLVQQFCPQVMPLTYCINDNNWTAILNEVLKPEQSHLIWILKPALLNNGQEIHIFCNPFELERHFLSANRMSGAHVLQQYIADPHLVPGPQGHKYSIRMFVILTNYDGVFIYPRGYFNVAVRPFTPGEFQDLRPHLTNEHLQETEANVVQIPSDRFESFPLIYPKIKAIVEPVIKGLNQLFPNLFKMNNQPKLAIFGFDFMMDSQEKLWLLEANHGPCFPTDDSHPLQKYLYSDFWQDFISSFVNPIARKKELYHQSFESIL